MLQFDNSKNMKFIFCEANWSPFCCVDSFYVIMASWWVCFNRIAARNEQTEAKKKQELEKFFYFQDDLWCSSVFGSRRRYRFTVLCSDCGAFVAFDSHPLSMWLLTYKFMNKIWTECFMLAQCFFFVLWWCSKCIRYSRLHSEKWFSRTARQYIYVKLCWLKECNFFHVGYPVVNDPLYNHEVFGPLKGRGGDIGGKTDEQLVRDLINIHNAENWLGIDGDSELSLFKTMKSDSDDGLGSLTGKGKITTKFEN